MRVPPVGRPNEPALGLAPGRGGLSVVGLALALGDDRLEPGAGLATGLAAAPTRPRGEGVRCLRGGAILLRAGADKRPGRCRAGGGRT